MSTTVLADPTQAMAEHQRHLKTYANRLIVRGESLRPEEEIDQKSRLKEFLALGMSFRLHTERIGYTAVRRSFPTEEGLRLLELPATL